MVKSIVKNKFEQSSQRGSQETSPTQQNISIDRIGTNASENITNRIKIPFGNDEIGQNKMKMDVTESLIII